MTTSRICRYLTTRPKADRLPAKTCCQIWETRKNSTIQFSTRAHAAKLCRNCRKTSLCDSWSEGEVTHFINTRMSKDGQDHRKMSELFPHCILGNQVLIKMAFKFGLATVEKSGDKWLRRCSSRERVFQSSTTAAFRLVMETTWMKLPLPNKNASGVGDILYTLWVKKNCATFIFTVSLANVGRFLKFFQCRNQKEMAHNKNEKFPTVA